MRDNGGISFAMIKTFADMLVVFSLDITFLLAFLFRFFTLVACTVPQIRKISEKS
jgi:hypothetical protein